MWTFGNDRKQIDILRTEEKIEIDGELNEAFWSKSAIATDFIQHTPLTGSASIRKTEVRIAYDNDAIYVSAVLFDQKDSMSRTLSQRDDLGNADWFGVIFDPYNAGTIGFAFLVTSAGVQVDELHNVNNIDGNWNAVWRSAVQIFDDRWQVEMKIPFSAIRFSKESGLNWGISFGRNIRRTREESFWNFYDPKGINLISQLGELNGLKDVDSPLRLAFTPYVSGYIENYNGTTGYSANGGMDVKWGVNEAFTIDITLVPDFGQVQFDNQVLNLSPFEVRFNERRQFFTEGTELFNKADIFYSRRVGGTPINANAVYADLDSNEVVEKNPITTQLYNATKFSGRTKKGTGIGVFNALTANTYAEITDTISGEQRTYLTNPMTNYNVFVLDQNMKNNSTFTFTNTNVWREGETYDANVSSVIADIYTKGQLYNVWGITNVSQKYEGDSVQFGHQVLGGFEKSAGNFQWAVAYDETGKNYNPNDLGFNLYTNIRNFVGSVRYNIFEPKWKFYRMWSSFRTVYNRIILPDAFSEYSMYMNFGGLFKNFMASGVGLYLEPVRRHDYFEPRVDGRFYESDAMIAPDFFISSNYGKPFALDVRGSWYQYFENHRYGFDLNISPRIRFNDKWFLIYNYDQNVAWNEEGAALTSDFELPFEGNDPIFAKRDRVTLTNTIDLSYIFNNEMGITFRLRHYWSKLEYNEFFRLNDDGKMIPIAYTGIDMNEQSLHNNAFNAFTIDMVYRWVFAPGSELSLVWKNSIFSFTDEVENNYFQNLGGMLDFPATNSISLKVLYYIDYWSLHQKIFKKK